MKKIEFIGRHGLSSLYVENSLEAVLACSENPQIDGSEIDIRMTADGTLVNMHNGSLNSITTSAKGKIIDTPFSELKNLQFHTPMIDKAIQLFRTLPYKEAYPFFFNAYLQTRKMSAPIATFEDILINFKPNKTLVVEAKVNKDEYSERKQRYYEDALVDMLKIYQFQKRQIVLEGYNLEAMYRIKEKLPSLTVGGLYSKNQTKHLMETVSVGFDFVSCEYPLIDEQLLEALFKHNMSLYSWDDKEPLQHYRFLEKILNDYNNVVGNEIPLGIINDFPVEAKTYLMSKVR
ncbi:MAG: glycerophosphodiester phosphodiesterase family protein [Bacilli bacterium]|nr:glycerophosphodiester phosphodiesterase family protein [Bacilli bacterium]